MNVLFLFYIYNLRKYFLYFILLIYVLNFRDSLLASLVDGIRASGNYQVFVTSRKFDRSLRILPFGQFLDEDGEAQLLKHIINVPR